VYTVWFCPTTSTGTPGSVIAFDSSRTMPVTRTRRVEAAWSAGAANAGRGATPISKVAATATCVSLTFIQLLIESEISAIKALSGYRGGVKGS
jgi:hypothetical protein